MERKETYREVQFRLRGVGTNVFMIEIKGDPKRKNLPRSLVFGPDERKLAAIPGEALPKDVKCKIFAWKAHDLGIK